MKANPSNLLLLSLLSAIPALAQNAAPAQAETPGLFSNTLFLVLLGLIVVLLIFIIILGEVVKSAGAFTKNDPNLGSKAGNILPRIMVLMFFLPLAADAQDAALPAATTYGGLSSLTFWSMMVIIAFELIIVISLTMTVRKLLGVDERKAMEADIKAIEEEKPALESFMDKFNAAVAVEDEKDILLDHNYDGIKELDNRLPPWWVMGFYFTIIWSLIYLVHYHVTRTGDLSDAEYRAELVKAEKDLNEYMKTAANLVDETNVKMIEDPAEIAKGKDIYKTNCAACHGQLGEGTVGPNLTDDYWIHGGSIQDIFKTVKYGFADKGMKPWKDDLSPSQIAMVSSFIKTLRGTNPPNAKEKQGDLFAEGAAPAASDSTANAQPDTSAKVSVPPAKAFH
jgi:cytochrome c oxidase cbb3-type subunit 3